MRKANKSEVDYSRGHAGAHCGKVLDDDKASAGLREKRSDIWFCEVPGGVQAPGHRHSASLGKRFLRHGGKRSDIDSWNLIQSVPEPRSLGSALPGGHSATALVAQIQLLDLESDRGLFPSITLNLVLDGLSLIERAQTSLLNSRNVDEHVLAATA